MFLEPIERTWKEKLTVTSRVLANSLKQPFCLLSFQLKVKLSPNPECRSFSYRGALRFFVHSYANHQNKLSRDPLVIFFWKKSYNAGKNWKVDTLVSSGIVCYAEKKEKLYQKVQFKIL